MDSKSISRKGVGVQVPALAPGDAPAHQPRAALAAEAERLARVYAPAIVERLSALGEAYAELAARLACTSAAELALLPELEAGEALAGELGYLLGVLSSAAGTGVLRARRLECAPRLFAELVAAHHGVALEPEAGELPLAARDARATLDGGAGWEGAFALAALFDEAARAVAGGKLRWSLLPRRAGWLVAFPDVPPPGRARARELFVALGALGVRAHGPAPGALLPRAWLTAPGSTARALPG